MNSHAPVPDIHPYSVEVSARTPGGAWGWAIRKHGKLLQRADRTHPSEDKAMQSALAQVERLRRGADTF